MWAHLSPCEEREDQDEGEGAAQRQPDHRVAQTRHWRRTLIFNTIQWEGIKLRMLKGFSKDIDRSCKYDAAPVVSAPPPHAAPPPA